MAGRSQNNYSQTTTTKTYQNDSLGAKPRFTSSDPKPGRCHKCGQFGHWANNPKCPKFNDPPQRISNRCIHAAHVNTDDEAMREADDEGRDGVDGEESGDNDFGIYDSRSESERDDADAKRDDDDASDSHEVQLASMHIAPPIAQPGNYGTRLQSMHASRKSKVRSKAPLRILSDPQIRQPATPGLTNQPVRS